MSNIQSPVAGQIFYDISASKMKMYDGTQWVSIDTSNTLFGTKISLVCSEQELNGTVWYTVQPKDGIFSVRQTWWENSVKYARATFKNETTAWEPDSGDWLVNNNKFWFRNEKDRTMFVLKIS